VSVIENEPAAVKLELTVAPPAVAVEVAVMVQTVAEVCTMPVIAEIFVKVKSVPEAVDKVEQVMSSLPVTVNVIVADVDVAAERNRVTVGAVVSMTNALFAPSEPLAPGVGRVRVAAIVTSA
jgi:hypothetical protein